MRVQCTRGLTLSEFLKKKTDDNGNSYLDLVRPQEFQDDEVEAIFMDEFSAITQESS